MQDNIQSILSTLEQGIQQENVQTVRDALVSYQALTDEIRESNKNIEALQSLFAQALTKGHIEIVDAFLEDKSRRAILKDLLTTLTPYVALTYVVACKEVTMWEAIKQGHSDIIVYLLQRGVSALLTKDSSDLPFLHETSITYAFRIGQVNIARVLLQHCSDFREVISNLFHSQPYFNNKSYPFRESMKMVSDYMVGYELNAYTNILRENFKFFDSFSQDQELKSIWKDINIAGFNFIGVTYSGKPITRKDLQSAELVGWEKAIVERSDLQVFNDSENIDEEKTRRQELTDRINENILNRGIVVNDETDLPVFMELPLFCQLYDPKALNQRLKSSWVDLNNLKIRDEYCKTIILCLESKNKMHHQMAFRLLDNVRVYGSMRKSLSMRKVIDLVRSKPSFLLTSLPHTDAASLQYLATDIITSFNSVLVRKLHEKGVNFDIDSDDGRGSVYSLLCGDAETLTLRMEICDFLINEARIIPSPKKVLIDLINLATHNGANDEIISRVSKLPHAKVEPKRTKVDENSEKAKPAVMQNQFLQTYTRQTLTLSQRFAMIYNGDKSLTQAFRDDAICEFLTLAVNGQEKKVLELLEMHPKLLLVSGITQDYSGRKIEGTVYQILLGAEDLEMCKKLNPFFAVLKDADGNLIGDEEKKKQFNAQFPDEIENKPSDYDFNPLISAIKKDPFKDKKPNANTQKALEKFQNDFKPNTNNVITTGRHFNMNHLIKAIEIYDKSFENDFYRWGAQRLSLFWQQVIGYLQRLVPACYAQAICQGIYNVLECKKPLERKFDLDWLTVYFPIDQDSRKVLGRDFAVLGYEGGYGATGSPGNVMSDYRRGNFQYYINQKHTQLICLKSYYSRNTNRQHNNKSPSCK